MISPVSKIGHSHRRRAGPRCRHGRSPPPERPRGAWGAAPGAAVAWWKQRRIVRLAHLSLKARGLGEPPCRFDVVAVTLEDGGATRIRHLPAAFDASGVI